MEDKKLNLSEEEEKFLEAYIANMGNVTKTCKAVDSYRMHFYRLKTTNPDFKKAIENAYKELDDVKCDFAEDTLLTAMEEGLKGNITAAIYILNNKGVARGYKAQKEPETEGSKVEVQVYFPEKKAYE